MKFLLACTVLFAFRTVARIVYRPSESDVTGTRSVKLNLLGLVKDVVVFCWMMPLLLFVIV